MRAVVFGPAYPFRGGIAHHTTSLFRAIAKRHEARLLTFTRMYPAFLTPGGTDREPNPSPYQEPAAEPMLDSLNPLSWRATGKAIKAFNPDLFILPWWTSYWAAHTRYLLGAADCASRVVICHNVSPHEPGWLDNFATRIVLKRCEGALVHSNDELARLQQRYPGVRAGMCHHPASRECQPSADREELRARLGMEGPTLLFAGFVRPYKRLDLLLAAMPGVLEKVPDAGLRVAGQFWKGEMEKAASIVSRLGLERQVTLVDRYLTQQELTDRIAACDLVVLPYDSVTGSGLLMDALALGRPVVASRLGCFQEIISDGADGLLFTPDSADSLAGEIIRGLQPRVQQALELGAAEKGTHYTWDKLARTVYKLAGL